MDGHFLGKNKHEFLSLAKFVCLETQNWRNTLNFLKFCPQTLLGAGGGNEIRSCRNFFDGFGLFKSGLKPYIP